MRRYLPAAVVIGVAMTSTGSWAQTSAVAEAQLANGFLGDQNSRLAASQGTPSDAPFAARAADAIARKDYGRALAILRPYRLAQTLEYRWLAGQAYAGLGDYPAALKAFAAAAKQRKNFTGAQVAMGLIEAEHGDKAAAAAIVAQLTARRDACAGKCADKSELASGIVQIEAALKARLN